MGRRRPSVPTADQGRDVDDDVVLSAPLFAGIDPDASRDLLCSMTPVDLPRGQALFHEGDPGDRLYIIRSGKVKLGRRSPDGRENLLSVSYTHLRAHETRHDLVC